MSADMTRRASFSGAPARVPSAGGTRLPQPSITAEAARIDKLDDDQFEKKARELAQPTLTRPALITTAEADAIRTGYGTGAGRLDVINKVTNKRLDYYTEAHGGGSPFDPISEGDRAKCAAFFSAHGTRLLDQPRQAPPNPLRETSPAASHAEADKAIVEAEAAKPAPQPAPASAAAPTSAAVPLHPLAMLDIEFLSEQGFHCQLHLQAPSWSGVLDQLGQATGRLATMKAKPLPAPVIAAAPAAGKPSGEIPICPVHNKRMKKSRKPGAWFCPVKDARTDEYCDEKFLEQ